jgi:hypothetical protein
MTRGLLAGLLLAAALIAPSARAQVTIQPPATGSPWTLTLPTSSGTQFYVLSTNGSGVTSWISNAGTASTVLSAVTAATATNTIDNHYFAQIWQWGTLSTGTAMTLTTSSMTSGTLLTLSNTSTAANAVTVLSVVNGEAGASYALKVTNSGAANTGYAGYFNNPDTGSGTNYGVYSTGSSTTATAGNFQNFVSSGSTIGLYGESDGTGGTAAYFIAKAATGSTNGIYAQANSTSGIAASFNATATSGTTYGLYSVAASTGTFGAGNFNASASSGTTYGLYSIDASASGYGGYLTNSTSTGIALFCSATLSTGCGGNQTWHSTSDIRLKKDIADLSADHGLNAILQLRPVTYRWKDKKTDKGRRIGLIAQQVEPLYPEIVGTDSGGMKSIGYGDLVVPLIKALQEQHVEIDALNAANDNLRRELDALGAKLAR